MPVLDDLYVIVQDDCKPPAHGAIATKVRMQLMSPRSSDFAAELAGREQTTDGRVRCFCFSLRGMLVTTELWGQHRQERLTLIGDDVLDGSTRLCLIAPPGTAATLARASRGLICPDLPLALVSHVTTHLLPRSPWSGRTPVKSLDGSATICLNGNVQNGYLVLHMLHDVWNALRIVRPGCPIAHAYHLYTEDAMAVLPPGTNLYIDVGGGTLHLTLTPLLNGEPLLPRPKRGLANVGGADDGAGGRASKSARPETPL